jgi:transcriptional regulator with XRE-family HTH domain
MIIVALKRRLEMAGQSEEEKDLEREKARRKYALELAERIKSLSKAKGVSVSNVLAVCDLQPNFVTNMTSRGSIPAADSFILVADYFDVPLDYLLGRAKKENECSELLACFEDCVRSSGITDRTFEPKIKDIFLKVIRMSVAQFLIVNDEYSKIQKGQE